MKFRKNYESFPRKAQTVIDKDDSLGLPCVIRREFRDICDINHICKKLAQDNILPVPLTVGSSATPRPPMYGDFSNGGDFQNLQDRQLAADSYFQSLPDDVRSRFGSSVQFFDSLNDPNIMQFLVERGVMAAPAKPKKLPKASVVTTPATANEPEPTVS